MEVRLVHEETDCCCCGRTVPSVAPLIVVNEGYSRPRAFCRRCYLAAPWRDGLPSNDDADEGGQTLGERG